jgi:allantoin racemase
VIVPLFITPTDAEKIRKDLRKYAWQGTTIDVIGHTGNIAVNSRSEADVAAPEFIRLAMNAEKSGYDAVISYCYADVGVDAAKEKLKINVIGPLETSAIVANILGTKFSAITIETATAYMQPRLRSLALDKNFISTRGISLNKYFVFSADAKQTRITQDSLEEECKKAVCEGANVLILACTGFPLAEQLKANINVPMVEATVTLKVAETLVDLRRAWHTPNRKDIGKSQRLSRTPRLRIKTIVPTSSDSELKQLRDLQGFTDPATELRSVQYEIGPKTIRSACDVALVAPFIVKESSTAREEGFDAVVIASYLDPAIASAREVCDIPVVGPGETSIMLACEYGNISIFIENVKALLLKQRIVRKLGVGQKVVSIRCLSEYHEASNAGLLDEMNEEVKKGADAIVLDMRSSKELFERLPSELPVPLISPYPAAIRMAEALCTLSLVHSKLAYPRPVLPKYHSERLRKLSDAPHGNMFLYKRD